jgi:hypothetical protein
VVTGLRSKGKSPRVRAKALGSPVSRVRGADDISGVAPPPAENQGFQIQPWIGSVRVKIHVFATVRRDLDGKVEVA